MNFWITKKRVIDAIGTAFREKYFDIFLRRRVQRSWPRSLLRYIILLSFVITYIFLSSNLSQQMVKSGAWICMTKTHALRHVAKEEWRKENGKKLNWASRGRGKKIFKNLQRILRFLPCKWRSVIDCEFIWMERTLEGTRKTFMRLLFSFALSHSVNGHSFPSQSEEK